MVPGTIFFVSDCQTEGTRIGCPNVVTEICGLPIENSRCVDEISSQPFRKFCRLFKNFYQPSKVSRLPTCLIRHHRRQPARTGRNAADCLCRSGTGRHEWRPYVLLRQLRTAITLGAARNAADCLCRHGNGRHEWRHYVWRRQLRTAITLGVGQERGGLLVPSRHRAS